LTFADSEFEAVSGNNNFSRIIELKNPQMYGNDIEAIQNRLLSLGFIDLGEADGYYDTKTDNVVKKIKTFMGYEEKSGKIDRNLWNFIFNDGNNRFLLNISIVSEYNENLYRKREEINSYGYEEITTITTEMYYSNDNKIKIARESRYWMGYMLYTRKYYFISLVSYFIFEEGPNVISGEYYNVYYMNSNRMYQIKEGVFSQSDFISSFLDEILNENLTF
jgi:hypothetical protein